jgi:diadenosine tetraphosphatase ApaH/serine/threonine PP2A family protein phosphatase
MKIAILSDIHGNQEALDAVAAELDRIGVRDLVCVGDVVGYGANPRECLDFVTERSLATVAGNHDLAAICEGASDFFNQAAKEACAWTTGQLRASDRAFLYSLPMTVAVDEMKIELVHADGVAPKMFDYLQDCVDGQRSLSTVHAGYLCFVGHTHVPVCFHEDGPFYSDGDAFTIHSGVRAIINVGSVGQPRDGDRRSAFGIFDSDERTVQLHRVAYDYETAARKIRDQGLPQVLGDRLKYGR